MAVLMGKSSDVRDEVIAWYRVARASVWRSLADVRRTYTDADQVGAVLIFNIRQNRYRLIIRESSPRASSTSRLFSPTRSTTSAHGRSGHNRRYPD
jgi:hypothetical protein